jgi:hypothetical protein
VKTISDSEPFDTSLVHFELGFVRGDPATSRARAEALRAMRLRVEQWGVARGFEIVESGLLRVAESVEVTIGFSNSTAEMCTLRSNALRPVQLHLQVEPKSWSDWIAARLGGGFETSDEAFDEHWHVETDNEPVAKHLLDARVRTALTNHPIWCLLGYTSGQIELRLDSGEDRLTGAHLLAATEVAVAISRATPELPSTPYR